MVRGACQRCRFQDATHPQITWELKTDKHIPRITVTPDDSQPVQRVDVYYSIDPHTLTRFWRSATTQKSGKQWQADAPVMSVEQPLFAFANVIYELPTEYRDVPQKAGQTNSDTFAISSRLLATNSNELQTAQVQPTDQPERLIDDGQRGWGDWYLLNWVHSPLWSATTRKLKDPKWRGPDDATLCFDIQSHTDNQLVITVNCNAWGAFESGQPATDYAVVKQLTGSKDWQPVTIKLSELVATDPKVTKPLQNWQTVTELTLSPSGTIVQDGQRIKSSGKAWQGPREIRNLRWEGGNYPPANKNAAAFNAEDFQNNFNNAIKKSLEQEQLDRQPK